jgi:putative PEP-CTERM system integral membrane protein
LWLRYQTLAAGNAWPLPQMSEKLNVFWDDNTVRQINGSPMDPGDAGADFWLPPSVPSTTRAISQSTHRVDFPGGQTVIARPVQADALPGLAGDVRLAVVLDRSRSMAEQQAAVETSFARLRELAGTGAQADIYLTASPYRGEAPSLARLEDFDPGSILYFGGQNAAELLAQFEALRGDQTYDAVLVVTDGSGYGLGEGDAAVVVPDAPLWMVHLGGFPLGYDDPTLDAIQASGGGAAASVDEALTRLAISLTGQEQATTTDVVDGYQWLTLPTTMADTLSSIGPASREGAEAFAPLAARRVILAEMRQKRSQITDLAVLDRLHALAANYGIVTPLSSMIVLVNQEQEWLLDKLESQDDRFLREHEDVGETVAAPAVAAVPEPEEWLLLGLAAGLLGYTAWTARRKRGGPVSVDSGQVV